MDIIYRKEGQVSVQDINLTSPKGKPISLEVSFEGNAFTLSVEAWDDLNRIGRSYPMDMDDQFKAELTQFFFVSIGRVMRENYPEFTDLILVDEP